MACSVARSLVRKTMVSLQFHHSKVLDVFTDNTIFLDKENGQKMTLPIFLKERTEEIKTAFSNLSREEKQDLKTRHLNLKEERDHTPKTLTNVAVSGAVNAKLKLIINTVLYDFSHLPNMMLSSS
jgi:hypothetical protein